MSITYQKLKERGTLLEGTLLKPSITMTGVDTILIRKNKCCIQLLLEEPPHRHSSKTLIINDVIVIIMPCYYNQQANILNVRRTKDKGEEDEDEDVGSND